MELVGDAKEFVEKVHSKGYLPALAANVMEVQRITSDHSTSAAQLANVIMRDCGLTSSILAVANSAFCATVNEVKTVSGAIVLLGFEKVRSMILGLSIFQQTMRSLRHRELSRLYASSYFSGLFARDLSATSLKKGETSSRHRPEEMFVAGLLYQFPMIAVANAYPQEFKEMETRVHSQHLRPSVAFERQFGLKYDDVCKEIAKMYGLPESMQSLMMQSVKIKQRDTDLIVESNKIATMIFSTQPVGKNAMDEEEAHIRKLTKKADFQLDDFIKDSCEKDVNVKRFFDLHSDDIDMMIKVLEWGKASPSQLTSKLAFGTTVDPDEEEEDPETLLGRFLTELMMANRKGQDLNTLLTLAQEALFRCLGRAHVFAAFKDVRRNTLRGRFYTGTSTLAKAGDLELSLTKTASPIVRAFVDLDSVHWSRDSLSAALGINETLFNRLQPRYALCVPIITQGRALGIYFIARSKPISFSDHEELWVSQLAQCVSASFLSIRKHDTRKQ